MTETQTGKQSRNGKKPVAIAQGVQVTISGQDVKMKGPKGELIHSLRPEVVVSQEEGQLTVAPAAGAGKAGLWFSSQISVFPANDLRSDFTMVSGVGMDIFGNFIAAQIPPAISPADIITPQNPMPLNIPPTILAPTRTPAVHRAARPSFLKKWLCFSLCDRLPIERRNCDSRSALAAPS